jgi:hypothetical protein
VNRTARLSLAIVVTACLLGASAQREHSLTESALTECTPGYVSLGEKRLLGSEGWNSSRVLIIGCEERLKQLPSESRAELSAKIAAFMDQAGWSFWWVAKSRDERFKALKSAEGFRRGDYTDFLLYSPVSGEP